MARSRGAKTRRARVGRGQRWTAAERARYLAEFARSGLSAAAFVRRTGVPQSTFDLWRHQAARRARAHRPAGFARVAVRERGTAGVAGGAASRPTLVLRWPTGPAAEFTGLDEAAIATVVRTLDALAQESRPTGAA